MLKAYAGIRNKTWKNVHLEQCFYLTTYLIVEQSLYTRENNVRSARNFRSRCRFPQWKKTSRVGSRQVFPFIRKSLWAYVLLFKTRRFRLKCFVVIQLVSSLSLTWSKFLPGHLLSLTYSGLFLIFSPRHTDSGHLEVDSHETVSGMHSTFYHKGPIVLWPSRFTPNRSAAADAALSFNYRTFISACVWGLALSFCLTNNTFLVSILFNIPWFAKPGDSECPQRVLARKGAACPREYYYTKSSNEMAVNKPGYPSNTAECLFVQPGVGAQCCLARVVCRFISYEWSRLYGSRLNNCPMVRLTDKRQQTKAGGNYWRVSRPRWGDVSIGEPFGDLMKKGGRGEMLT